MCSRYWIAADDDGELAKIIAALNRKGAPEIAFIHERMPVILPAERLRDWLNPQNDARDILQTALRDMEYQRV